MVISSRGRVAALSIAVLSLLSRCGSDCSPPKPLDTTDIVVSHETANANPFGVDICLDATPSMEGFAAPPDSIYRTFIEDLEGSLGSGVKNVSDLRFFKFGQTIREVPRAEFRNARNGAFYHESGIFRDTNIELVFQRANDKSATTNAPPAGERRVIVVVTDLFQKDQDVNAVVQQIKTRCLSDPQCSVGLMVIPSQFEGTVYDAHVPSYAYRSSADPSTYRPFYLMMFGPEGDLRRFADVLSARKYIDLHRFTIIGGRTVSSFSADVTRNPGSPGITKRKHCGTALDSSFNLRKKFDEAAIKAVVKITPDPQSFPIDPSRVEVRAFREQNGKLVPAANGEVSIQPAVKGGALEINASLRPQGKAGDYVYVFDVVTGEVNGFGRPKWVQEYTSSDPKPDHEAFKTLNLDRFVEQLIATSILEDAHQPKLARFRVLIHKL